MFKVGEIVVCTNARRRWFKLGGLKQNEMYTIKGFNPHDGGLILKEVKSPGSGFNAFASDRFRKVDYAFANSIVVGLDAQQHPTLTPQSELKRELQPLKYKLSLLN